MTVTSAPRAATEIGGPAPHLAPHRRATLGTAPLLRHVLRRDRLRIPLWAAGAGGMVLVSAASLEGLYDTEEELAAYRELVRGNTALIVQSGPGHGLDDPTLGTVLVNETSVWAIVLVAIMSAMLVVRHTRAEEETGRAELVRSAPVGRHAATMAALLAALVASTAVGLVVAVGLVLSDLPASGAVAYGLALVGVGAVFAGVGLVAAQVASSARTATGLSLVVLAVAFVLRAVGDVGDGRLSWLSPIGWAQATRPFADERWPVLTLPALAGAGLVLAATALAAHRDAGAGLIPHRAGRDTATRWLTTPLALSARLLRGTIAGWAAGVAAIGFFYGVVSSEAESIVQDNPELAEFFAAGGASITDAFLASGVLMVGLLSAAFAVTATARAKVEETEGRLEPLLTTPTSRTRWAGSHMTVVAGGLLVVLTAGGLSTGVGAAASLNEPGRVPELLAAALSHAPASAVLGAVAFLLWAAAPRWTVAAWAGVALAVVVGLLADVLDLPQAARDLSPFEHVPDLPAAEAQALPLLVLGAVAVALAAGGLAAFRRRDLAAS